MNENNYEHQIKELKAKNHKLTQALTKIAEWNVHTTEYALNYGSCGVRDLYRAIAKDALTKTK